MTLKIPDPLVVVRPPTAVRRRSDGRLLLARGRDGGPLEFAADGAMLRVLGGRGDGPGEFRAAEIAEWSGDTVFVFDREQRRLTVLGAAERKAMRTAPLPDGFTSARVLPAGGFVVNAEVNDRARIGKPLHVFDAVGNYLRSIGDLGESYVRGVSAPPMMVLAPTKSSGVWAVQMVGRARAREWLLDGSVADSINLTSPWFTVDWDRQRRVTSESPPPPLVLAAEVDSSDRLWVMTLVPSESWASGVTVVGSGAGEGPRRLQVVDRDLAFDTIIEVFSTRARSRIAHARLDLAYSGFASPGYVVHAAELADGSVRVRIGTIELRSR